MLVITNTKALLLFSQVKRKLNLAFFHPVIDKATDRTKKNNHEITKVKEEQDNPRTSSWVIGSVLHRE